jgi:hypothetical protein
MMLPHVVIAVLIILVASTLPSLLLSASIIVAVLVVLFALAAMGGSPGSAGEWIGSFLGIAWAYLRSRRRWMESVPPILLWTALMLLLWLLAPTVHTDRTVFLHEYSSFLQTAAQVLIALLIALAIEVRTPKPLGDEIGIRLATVVILLMLAVGEVACLAVLSPFLPAALDRWTLYLVIASGGSAILALVLVSWRILGEEQDVY